jgi:hypothetical protein
MEAPVSSRLLKMRESQNRLKSIDIMSLFLLFTNNYVTRFHSSELFALFVEMGGVRYNALIEGVTIDRIHPPDGQHTAYRAAINSFNFDGVNRAEMPSIAELCKINYTANKTIESAELIVEFTNPDPAQQIVISNAFLSGNNPWLPSILTSKMVFPGSIFEESLWGENIAVKSLEYELAAELEVAQPFAKLLLLCQLVTIAEGEEAKNNYYNNLIESLEDTPTLWNDILLFASQNRGGADYSYTLFDAVQKFPGALNPALFNGSRGTLYNKSVDFFNANQPDSAALYIIESINYEGITPEKLQLAAAISRLQKNFQQSLLFSVLAANYGLNTKFVPGNLYISLKALNYPQIEKFKQSLLNNNVCDTWSLSVIQ